MYDYAHEILTREEMIKLVIKAQKGCTESKEAVISHNVKLVEVVIKKNLAYAEKDELMQEGIIGVCEAINKFDLTKGTAFSTYAMIRIRKRVGYFLKDNRTIKIPHWVYSESNIEEIKRATDPMSLNIIDGEEFIGGYDDTLKMENRDILERLFERIDSREKHVIIETFSEGKTLTEIGKELGMSKERVRQIKCMALKKMKKRGMEDELKFKRFN